MSKVTFADEQTNRRRGIDHIGVCIVGIIHDGNGRILLMKRGNNARDEHGTWDVCGGAIEFGEPIDEAIDREVKEELCTKPVEVEFLKVYDAHREHEGKQTHWIALVHAVQVDPDKVKNGEPHKIDEIGWFTSSTLPTPLHSQFGKIIDDIKAAGILK